MVRGLAERADSRVEATTAAIRDALTEDNHHAALNLAIRAVQSEMAKVRRHRPADAALIDAELAAALLAIAARAHGHKPRRPANCPLRPRPGDLLRVFTVALDRALRRGDSHG